MLKPVRRAYVIALGVVLVLAVGTLVVFRSQPSPAACLPEQPIASPTSARAGELVTITSGGFTCVYRLPRSEDANIAFAAPDRQFAVELGTVTVAKDGSYKARVAVPPGAAPGPAYFVVSGGVYDNCQDDEGSGCGGGEAAVTVLP